MARPLKTHLFLAKSSPLFVICSQGRRALVLMIVQPVSLYTERAYQPPRPLREPQLTCFQDLPRPPQKPQPSLLQSTTLGGSSHYYNPPLHPRQAPHPQPPPKVWSTGRQVQASMHISDRSCLALLHRPLIAWSRLHVQRTLHFLLTILATIYLSRTTFRSITHARFPHRVFQM